MKIKNVFISIFVIMSLFSVAFAETSPSNIGKAMMSLCGQIKSALAIGMMLLIVLAAITYAVGQMMGAETRARASVWATAMFVGALIGALIYIIMPFILGYLAPDLFTGVPAAGGTPSWDSICPLAATP